MTTSPPKGKAAPKPAPTPPIEALSIVKQCGLTPAQVIKLVTVNVETAYQSASESFFQNPSTINWKKLHAAMFALQYWRGRGGDETDSLVVAGRLLPHPVMAWVGLLRDAATAIDLDD